jgi:hypothetical protein
MAGTSPGMTTLRITTFPLAADAGVGEGFFKQRIHRLRGDVLETDPTLAASIADCNLLRSWVARV